MVGLVTYARSEGSGSATDGVGNGSQDGRGRGGADVRRRRRGDRLRAADEGAAVHAARGSRRSRPLRARTRRTSRSRSIARAQAGARQALRDEQLEVALDVTAKARPWTQSASGVAMPNRRGALGGVAVSEETFTLAPGTRKELTVTLNGVPSSGYLYGALEVVGLPADLEQRKGVVAGYRLVNSLRYTPAAPRPRASRPARSRSSARARPRRSRSRCATRATRSIRSAAR